MATAACSGNAPSSTGAPDSGGYPATAAPAYTQPEAAPLRDGLQQAPPHGPPTAPKPDIVTTGTMTITVPNPSEAADKAAGLTESAHGRVQSRSESAGSWADRAQTSILLRIPTARLDGVLRDLKKLGNLKTADTTSDDVTAQRVDLDARIAALHMSVGRLLGIMRDSKDTDALIKAESELSKRQAELDSLRAQRTLLGEQIAYSSITVTFLAEEPGPSATAPRYQGFFGEMERGWDALVAAANSVLLLFGLLLPWLGALTVLGAASHGIRRAVRRRRSVPAQSPPQQADTP